MKKNLTTTQSTEIILKKSKSMLNITNRILLGKTALTKEVIEDWIKSLWAWADENDIGDLEWVEDYVNGECWKGLARDKEKLLTLKEITLSSYRLEDISNEIFNLKSLTYLNLEFNQLQKLPKEIGKLINLTNLNLHRNLLEELPKEIVNLRHLKTLDLTGNTNVILTNEQERWKKELQKKGCIVYSDFD